MSPKITASSPSTTATEKSIIRERPVDQWRGGFNCKMLPAQGEEEAGEVTYSDQGRDKREKMRELSF